MNILLITDLYPLKNDKTIPNAIKDFVLGLKDLGDNVFVLRPNFLLNTIIRKHKIFKEGIYFEDDIKIYNKNFILPFLNDNTSFLEEKYDIIISHLPSGHIYANLINKKLNLPHVSILHQSDKTVLEDFKYKFYFRKKLQNAIKNSNLTGVRNKFLYKKYDFILPSFIEKNNILEKKETISKNKLKIITLSKLIKRKNIDLVIKALKNSDFDFEYSIYGEGNEKKNLQKLIKNYNLEQKIKIYPYLEHNKINNVLDKNDIFILPSINETFGLVYLEAMSRGLITIGTKNTGIDGIIQDGINGYLVEPDYKKIEDIFKKIIVSDKEEMIKNTLLTIKNYEKEKIITKYLNIIKNIL